jgi:hypothetical protein
LILSTIYYVTNLTPPTFPFSALCSPIYFYIQLLYTQKINLHFLSHLTNLTKRIIIKVINDITKDTNNPMTSIAPE